MEPKILFEDAALVALDKPSGMIVYPDGTHEYPAVSAWLHERYGEGNFFFVHRLDRETSGLLLVAKTPAAHEFLKKQFQARAVRKTYRAFLYGALTEERGVISKPIGSARGGAGPRSARQPRGAMREATTVYRRIAGSAAASYVEAFPKTGRTHQLRVHFSSIQHPVICDPLYAPERAPLLGFGRLALHALALAARHPLGAEMTFEAPLPADFVQAERELRNG